MFLKIPNHQILTFDFAAFADHVLDHSPVIQTRSMLRLAMKARDGIAAAADGMAEIPDDAAELFQRAAAEAPIPRLSLQPHDAQGQPVGAPTPVAARVFDPFYEALESMTKERPAAPALAAAAE